MAYQLFNVPPQQPLSAAGRILSGCKASFFLTNSSTPADVYTTYELNVAHTQPVEADAAGRFDAIYLDPEVTYKVTITDANDVLLYTIDPCNDQLLSQAVVGRYLYPKTAAETSAAATIENYAFPPGDVRRYGATMDGATDDASALSDAIAQCVEDGGAFVYVPNGALAIGSAVVLLSGTKIIGAGKELSTIHALDDDFSLLTDNNTAVTDILIQDVGFEATAVESVTGNRAIFLDADTASASERITVRRCHFSTLFRGLNAHRVQGLIFEDCTAEDLGSSILYVGLSTAGGRSSDVRISGIECADLDNAADAAGTGVIFVGYADKVRITDCEFTDCGAYSGVLTTHHHSLYLRDCTDLRIRGIVSIGQRRGAGVQVFSDTGAGESASERVTITDVCVSGTTHYAGVRVDQVKGLTLTNIHAEDCYTQACYITNVTGLAASNVVGKNNNRQGSSGTDNAMWWLGDIAGGTFTGCIAIDDVTTGVGVYGQGSSFAIHGACTDLHWSACNHNFGGHSGSRYYGIEVVTASTLTGFSVHGFTTDGASSSFHETGTATLGSFDGIEMRNANVSDLLSIDQLHKFRCRAVIVAGSPWRFESNGSNLIEWRTNFPSSGNYLRDDRVIRSSHAASATPGWWCTADHVASNGGTWKAEANLAA